MEPRHEGNLDIPNSKCTICGSSLATEQPQSGANHRCKTYREIPRSLRSCSFDYSTVNPANPRCVYIYIYTRGEHLQNLTGWSLTRESCRCEIVVIGLIASRFSSEGDTRSVSLNWTLLYQHRENFIAGHVSTVRLESAAVWRFRFALHHVRSRAVHFLIATCTYFTLHRSIFFRPRERLPLFFIHSSVVDGRKLRIIIIGLVRSTDVCIKPNSFFPILLPLPLFSSFPTRIPV